MDLLGNVTHLPEKDATKVQKEASDGLKWLENNRMATKKEIEERRSSVEKICTPIIENFFKVNRVRHERLPSSSRGCFNEDFNTCFLKE